MQPNFLIPMKYKNLIFILAIFLLYSAGCKKENDPAIDSKIILKNGNYTQNEQLVPVGGQLKFGITATDGGAIITNLKILRSLVYS